MVTPRGNQIVPYPWIDGLTKRQQEQLYLDFEALANQGTGTRWGTVVIAAANSSTASKNKADFVCGGSGDEAKISQAIAALLLRSTRGGKLVMLEGTYNTSAAITIGLTTSQELVIEGMSSGTPKQLSTAASTLVNGVGIGTAHVFDVTGGSCTFRNLTIAASTSAVSVPIWADNTRLTVDHCTLSGYGGVVDRTTAGGVSTGGRITNCTISCVGGNGITLFASDQSVVAYNVISVTGASIGIATTASLGFSSECIIVGNDVSGGVLSTGISVGSGNTLESVCMGNQIRSCGIGAITTGSGLMISNNTVDQCLRGIVLGGGGAGNIVTGNNVLYTGTATSAIEAAGSNCLVGMNKCNVTASGGFPIIVTGSGTSVVFNDGPTGGPVGVNDGGTGTKRESDWLLAGQTANINARVGVRKNSTGSTSLRRRLNLIEGSGISFTVTDDPTDEEVDIIITSAVAAAIAAKGDLLVGLSTGTLTRLPVDRDDQILVTDSTTPEGVKWGPRLTISSAAPTSPRAGDIWLDTT